MMLWSEIPAYQVRDTELRAVTPAGASRCCARTSSTTATTRRSSSGRSANELDPVVGPVADGLHRRRPSPRPTRSTRRDRSALAFQGYPSIGCQAGYAPLDVLGAQRLLRLVPGAVGADRRPRACSPDYLAAGARLLPEAGDHGHRVRRRGQPRRAGRRARHLRVPEPVHRHSARDLRRDAVAQSGAIYWALQDFLVRPGWTGGNPYPTPPVFHKGLLDLDGTPKPAVAVVQAAFARDDADRLAERRGRMRPPAGRRMRRSRARHMCRVRTGQVATMPGRMATSTLTRLDVRSRAPGGSRAGAGACAARARARRPLRRWRRAGQLRRRRARAARRAGGARRGARARRSTRGRADAGGAQGRPAPPGARRARCTSTSCACGSTARSRRRSRSCSRAARLAGRARAAACSSTSPTACSSRRCRPRSPSRSRHDVSGDGDRRHPAALRAHAAGRASRCSASSTRS